MGASGFAWRSIHAEQREKSHDGILVMNEQCSCAPAWAKSGCPERFLIAVEQKDFEAVREAIVELFDLSIEALRPVSAYDQQTRDSYPVQIGL
jgi:hypothetical protein